MEFWRGTGYVIENSGRMEFWRGTPVFVIDKPVPRVGGFAINECRVDAAIFAPE
jgi:hypothetical protein